MTRYGWDLSHYDWDRHPVSLAGAKRAGIRLVTHKATEGTTYVDERFADYAAQLGHVGFPVAGSYHVLHRGNITAQVDFWIATVERDFPGWRKHPCWIWQIDAERWPDGNPTAAEVKTAADYLHKRVGCAPTQILCYGPGWVYGDTLSRLPYHLWQSNYGSNPVGGFRALYPGDDSAGWDAYSGQTPVILQYGSQATIGAQHGCDANAIRVNTDQALVRLFIPTQEDELSAKEVTELKTAINAHIDATVDAAVAKVIAAMPLQNFNVAADKKKHALGWWLHAVTGKWANPKRSRAKRAAK